MDNEGSVFHRIKRQALFGLLVLTVAGFSAGLGVATVIAYQVFFGNDAELKKSTILARINEETTIYTLDEETRIGSFFDNAHRRYVPIDEVPAHMIRAMVASEDKNFFNHVGIDPTAIGLAFVEGLANGFRFKRGGSTITQQTVKNILDRREHSFKRKFKEMIRALQLERMYSKQQIMEFYLNQFHVTANGNGIGIAAQYYFSKDVRDLTLVEAAFIAGSVKAPSKYNPFIKYTKAAREEAWREADLRKNYVIRRMYEQGWIKKDELEAAWNVRVPFKRGKFRTSEVALVSLVKSQLNKKEILEALNMESLDELNHAGLRVYTTLDAKLQENAQLQMRRNLSRLETILDGFSPENPDEFRPLRSLEIDEFYFGKVIEVGQDDKKQPIVKLDFGLPKGVIPYDSLMRTAKLLNLPTYKGEAFHLKEILSKIKAGDILFVEVKEYDNATHEAVVELRRRPHINGGIIAVDKGEVRAVVAGFDAKGYNRAMFATRQPGSVFKSVVYFAALQLGWSVIDRLDNQRQVFPFQGKFYYPRPDHISPYPEVSMLWAGVKSENLASIYLADKLLDKLNLEQFKALMGKLKLLPEEGESERDFHYRVARETGVQLDNEGLREHLLEKAIHDIKPDLIFSGRQSLLNELDRMWWGRGYLAELQRLYAAKASDLPEDERNLRVGLIKNNYTRLNALGLQLVDDWNQIAGRVGQSGAESVFTDSTLNTVLSRFRVMTSVGNKPNLAYIRNLPGEELPEGRGDISLDPVPGRALNPLDVQAIWGDAGLFGESAGITVTDVKLSGYLPFGYFKRIQQGLEERYEALMSQQEKYDLGRYYNHHDFRIILGLSYLVELARAMGVYSPLEPVLSFPLGTNAVSVAEVGKIYQTFTDGKIYRFYEEGPENQLNFIRRIEDRDGNVLFQPERKEYQLIDECTASQMSEILRKVVTHGTGSRARGELQIALDEVEGLSDQPKAKGARIRVPAFGKTGTTNDYTTAYFAGFLPYPTSHRAPLTPNNSYVIASYVGYDYNKTMRRGGYKISGAYGALPVWTDFAKALLKITDYGEYLDTLDLGVISRQEWPLAFNTCTAAVKVDLPRGAVLRAAGSTDVEHFGFTDIERDGEDFVDEFARNASVRSVVRLATTVKDGVRSPLRRFKPFTLPDAEEGANLDGLEDASEQAEEQAEPVPETAPSAEHDAPADDHGEAAPRTDEPETQARVKTIDTDPLPFDRDQDRPQRPDFPLDKERGSSGGGTSAAAGANGASNGDRPAPSRPQANDGEGEDDPGFVEEELW